MTLAEEEGLGAVRGSADGSDLCSGQLAGPSGRSAPRRRPRQDEGEPPPQAASKRRTSESSTSSWGAAAGLLMLDMRNGVQPEPGQHSDASTTATSAQEDRGGNDANNAAHSMQPGINPDTHPVGSVLQSLGSKKRKGASLDALARHVQDVTLSMNAAAAAAGMLSAAPNSAAAATVATDSSDIRPKAGASGSRALRPTKAPTRSPPASAGRAAGSSDFNSVRPTEGGQNPGPATCSPPPRSSTPVRRSPAPRTSVSGSGLLEEVHNGPMEGGFASSPAQGSRAKRSRLLQSLAVASQGESESPAQDLGVKARRTQGLDLGCSGRAHQESGRNDKQVHDQEGDRKQVLDFSGEAGSAGALGPGNWTIGPKDPPGSQQKQKQQARLGQTKASQDRLWPQRLQQLQQQQSQKARAAEQAWHADQERRVRRQRQEQQLEKERERERDRQQRARARERERAREVEREVERERERQLLLLRQHQAELEHQERLQLLAMQALRQKHEQERQQLQRVLVAATCGPQSDLGAGAGAGLLPLDVGSNRALARVSATGGQLGGMGGSIADQWSPFRPLQLSTPPACLSPGGLSTPPSFAVGRPSSQKQAPSRGSAPSTRPALVLSRQTSGAGSEAPGLLSHHTSLNHHPSNTSSADLQHINSRRASVSSFDLPSMFSHRTSDLPSLGHHALYHSAGSIAPSGLTLNLRNSSPAPGLEWSGLGTLGHGGLAGLSAGRNLAAGSRAPSGPVLDVGAGGLFGGQVLGGAVRETPNIFVMPNGLYLGR